MGQGFSDEEDIREEKGPRCDARYLHWLLSDQSRVHEAFKAVWQGCGPDDRGVSPKSTVLEVMLRVVGEFERSGGDMDITGGLAAEKTARQLRHVVALLPEQLTRTEALHLFRTALLALQTALVVKPRDGSINGEALMPLYSQAYPVSGPGLGPEAEQKDFSAGAPRGGGDLPANDLRPTASELLAMDAVKAARRTAKAEDATTTPPISRQQQQQPMMQPSATPLPSRQELEIENDQLESLSENLAEEMRQELNVVRRLEEEVKAQSTRNSVFSSRPTTATSTVEDSRSDKTEESVMKLESQIEVKSLELTRFEGEVASQQREINQLIATRRQEEVAADECVREARDATAELKTCKRTCGSLESEIASEEARASALREAFEGRRARFATAETAARNAELSTMRATRRRVAAESAVHREAAAVEEARHAREFSASQSALKIESLQAELAEVRLRCGESLEADTPGKRIADTVKATSDAQATLKATRAELALAEHERDQEVALERQSATEVQELEMMRARAEQQLARRETELHAAQDSILRTELGPPSDDQTTDDKELAWTVAAIREVEERLSAMRQREAVVQEELREARAGSAVVNPAEEPSVAAALWQRAREIAAELGEARAALVRRRAQEQCIGADGVVQVMRATLKEVEQREARTAAELAEARGQSGQFESSQARGGGQRTGSRDRRAQGRQLPQVAIPGATAGNGQDVNSLRNLVASLQAELDRKSEVILKLDGTK
mmetsp:Transcript_10547/g.19413  ORF Transcript_10547/g.19413 Transcript_10547/m.19413 type:complete len:739 (-) Transcript_10547:54-2270(-)